MTILDDFKASQASVLAHVAALESSVSALVLANSTIVDALRALQGAPAGVATAADLQGVIDANTAALAAIDASKAAADAAAAVTP